MDDEFLTELEAEGVLANEVFRSFVAGGFTEHQGLVLTAYWLVASGAQERLETELEYDDEESG